MDDTVYKVKRGRVKSSICKFTLADINQVKKNTLSQDLDTNRLFWAFKEKYPQSNVSFTFYHKVFITDFPKLSFRKPNTDTCKKCERLHNGKKSCDKTLAETAKRSLEIHQRKSEHAYNDL